MRIAINTTHRSKPEGRYDANTGGNEGAANLGTTCGKPAPVTQETAQGGH